ncbi:SDR family NAD(P)-dependent oxidoreductase [Roseibium sp.]|uniref:SDR family NAD(P)-dependent oxidoreductase n=1 Tax=Roseibium sp. TaxID=1936156 RepID=UPI003A97B6F5
MKLRGRTAIVTGAGAGLGRSHALLLAGQGANLVLNDMNGDNAEAVATEIRDKAGNAIASQGSVTSEADVALMVERASAEFGSVDILVNNAGILRDKTFAKMDLADFRKVVDVHLMGSVICTKAVWELMREQRYGRIVMTTSSSGLYGNFGQSNYGAAKMALVGLMQTLALEGDKYGIKVNCLAPTAATGMTADLFDADVLARLSPEAVSPGVLALVAEEAPTRTILCAGGGHFAQAHVTLTKGIRVANGDDVAQHFGAIGNRTGESVPTYGFAQVEQEVESAKRSG